MSAGERNVLITVERVKVTENAMGGRSNETWTKLVDAWASVKYGTGSERRVAAQEGAALSATFRIPSSINSRKINPKDRVIIKGESPAWDIISAIPVGQNESVDITATRDA